MAKNSSLICVSGFKNSGKKIIDSDVTNIVDIVTAPIEGLIIDSISITSTDTVPNVLYLYINDGASDFCIGNIQIPAESGRKIDGTVNAVSGLNITKCPFLKTDNSGNYIIQLEGDKKLRASVQTNVTSLKEICIFITGLHFTA